jgi:predicted MPP superfamily phosphohydrolase
MKERSRGLRQVLRQFQAAFRPAAPFESAEPRKGWLEAVAAAQPHVWRRYRIKGRVRKPLTCVVMSDLHVGSHSGDLDRFDRIVRELQPRNFDLLLLPGDFVNMQAFGGGRIPPQMIAEVLAPLVQQAPAVAVLGNHDAEYGNQHVASALEQAGIHVLANAAIPVETEAGPVHVAGLEDHSTGSPDIRRAFAGIPVSGSTIVLAHDPASFADIPEGPLVTVCGHTHGGQIRLPLLGALVNASDAPMAWTHGHITDRGRHLVVSAGLGTSGIPMRLNCPPEIVEILIEPGEDG